MELKILNNLTRKANKMQFILKKHSPEILIVGGTIGVVASTVMACVATTKVSTILENTSEQVDKVHEVLSSEEYEDTYSEEDSKRDLTIIYAKTGVELIKLYSPSIIVGVFSLGAIITSHKILKKRNIAIAAAYATVDKGFKEYRNRVIEQLGEEAERKLRYDTKIEEIEQTETNENGEEVKVKKAVNVVNPSAVASPYARFFEKTTVNKKGETITNPNWCDSNEYNIHFLTSTQKWANDRLRLRGYLFLNEVYEMLGLPPTKEGQIVGWVYNEDNPIGDNFVDFGLYKDNLSYSDFVNGFDPAILLDFNVDGNIWELM